MAAAATRRILVNRRGDEPIIVQACKDAKRDVARAKATEKAQADLEKILSGKTESKP